MIVRQKMNCKMPNSSVRPFSFVEPQAVLSMKAEMMVPMPGRIMLTMNKTKPQGCFTFTTD